MHSLFYPDIKNLIQTMENSGLDLQYVKTFLKEFDSYCMKQYPHANILTSEIAEDWIHTYTTHSKQQLDKRVRTMKHLGRYQCSVGKQAYIPRYKIASPRPEPPSLFTDEQLKEFFTQLDNMEATPLSPNREVIFPVLFRLIYCCGLRSSEACKLKIEDIDFEKSKLTIYHSKGYKSREVYMSDDVSDLCFRFHKYYKSIIPEREYFFQPSLVKPKYLNTDVCATFDIILKKTSFSSSFLKKPTTHGFRHLFAVKSMKKCLESGENFNNWIKYLSKYMGHKSSNETMYYLHMVADLFPVYKNKLETLVEGFGVNYVED